jgi:AraC-like DNA-binding protein
MANIFLAVLLVVFAARIIKSVGYYFADDHRIPDLLMNIGFGTNLAIFPLLWLYLNAFLNIEYQFDWRRDLLHLIPALTMLSLSGHLTDYFWISQNGYFVSLIFMLAYIPFCAYLVIKHFKSLGAGQRVWVLSLLAGVTMVWLSYLLNFVWGVVPYITGPVLFSFLVYYLTIIGLKQSSLFTKSVKYQQSAFAEHQIELCYQKLMEWLSEHKPFQDSSLTLPKMAGQLNVSNNLLSETINRKTHCNFPDFINSYRVREARALLENPEFEHQKIASIAFDVGFNSLSVFNAAFKKFTAETPSTYRKKRLKR